MQQQTPVTLPIVCLHPPRLHGPIPQQLPHPLERGRDRLLVLRQHPLPRRQRHPDRVPLLDVLDHVVRLPLQVVVGDARPELELLEGTVADGAPPLLFREGGGAPFFFLLIVEPDVEVDGFDDGGG